jgi:hypothetical protein
VIAFAAVVCVAPLSLQLPGTTFGIVLLINLRQMAVTGVPPGDVMIALMFAAAAAVAAAFMFGGGG